jgi:hypothetical protein
LMCDGFSLDKTIRLGNFEFIVDYFSSLSLSPRRGNVGSTFMGSTHSRMPTPRRAMIEDSVEEFLTALSSAGSFNLHSSRRRGTGASLALITTTPRMENAPATQAMMIVPPRTAVPQPETGLPFERHHTHHGGQ